VSGRNRPVRATSFALVFLAAVGAVGLAPSAALGVTGALSATRAAVTSFTGSLSTVSVVSAKDAWAAGYNGATEMMLHWNGTTWARS
jgi:hypothetical protein